MQYYCTRSKRFSQIPLANNRTSSILKLEADVSGNMISSIQVVCLQILQ